MIRKSRRRAGLLWVGVLYCTGCVSLKPASRAPGAEALVLDGVPTAEFGVETCGAASLSAVMAFWGLAISIDELDRSLPKADNGGVLSLDLVLAARGSGLDAELVAGSREQILESLDSGRPLILMLRILDAIGDNRDLYHYVIVDGIDPSQDLVRVHYGDGSARWVSLARLTRSWEDTGFATVLVRPRTEPAQSLDSIRYAVALEESGRLEEAEGVYRRLIATTPESALIWANLGNVQAARGHAEEAETAYRRALEIEPEQPEALNNLAWLLLESKGDLAEALELASRAVSLGRPDPHLALDTLGRIRLEMGECAEAIEVFQAALQTTPAGSPARGRVLYGLALSQRDCGLGGAAAETFETALLECADPDLCPTLQAELQALLEP